MFALKRYFLLIRFITYLNFQVRFTRAEAPKTISELPGYMIQALEVPSII
jgi:hypothetical protein